MSNNIVETTILEVKDFNGPAITARMRDLLDPKVRDVIKRNTAEAIAAALGKRLMSVKSSRGAKIDSVSLSVRRNHLLDEKNPGVPLVGSETATIEIINKKGEKLRQSGRGFIEVVAPQITIFSGHLLPEGTLSLIHTEVNTPATQMDTIVLSRGMYLDCVSPEAICQQEIRHAERHDCLTVNTPNMARTVAYVQSPDLTELDTPDWLPTSPLPAVAYTTQWRPYVRKA